MRSPWPVHGALPKCHCQAAWYEACLGRHRRKCNVQPRRTPCVILSTCAADDADIASRSTFIIAKLKKAQDSLGGGYLSAFPTEHFDRLQNLQPVWAPYYVVGLWLWQQSALSCCDTVAHIPTAAAAPQHRNYTFLGTFLSVQD